MKVYSKSDGKVSEHESVDAREIVAQSPDQYTLTDPNAKPGEHQETAGEVLQRTDQAQKEDSARAQYQQQADRVAISSYQSDPKRQVEADKAKAEQAAKVPAQPLPVGQVMPGPVPMAPGPASPVPARGPGPVPGPAPKSPQK